MESNTHIYQLIQLSFENRLSPEQKAELQNWINESAANEAELKKISRTFELANQLKAMKKINTGKDLEIVKSKFKKQSTMKHLLLQYQKIAAILLLPLFLFSLWMIYSRFSGEITSPVSKIMETNHGVRSQIVLADGSKVWLNAGSKLYYPEEFKGKTREVKLEGEAYFEVESDKEHPFYVNIGELKVKATGTKFNITNYKAGDNIYIYLRHGKVQLVAENENREVEHLKMKEGEIVTYARSSRSFSQDNSNGEKFIGWTEGKLIFRNDNIKDVAARLGYWYNAEITVADNSLNEYIFTATFKYETLDEALELLSFSSPISYKIISSGKTGDPDMEMKKVIIEKKKPM